MTSNPTSHSADYSLQLFTLPNTTYAVAYGINDLGEVTGVSGIGSFIDNHGSITSVTVPISAATPLAINNLGQVVGQFTKSDGGHAFEDTNGTISYFATLPPAAVVDGRATGINDLGQVVGQFTGFSGNVPETITAQFGFIDNSGTLTDLTLSNGAAFLPTGINDFDQIVGTTTAGVSGVLDLKTDKFTSIEVSGAKSTTATAINNLGQVAGTYIDSAGSIHAFVDTYGHFEFLPLPANFSGTLTAVTAINDLGQVVEQFVGSNGVAESYIATPKSPLQPLMGGLADLWHGHASLPAGIGHYLDINLGHVNLPHNAGPG